MVNITKQTYGERIEKSPPFAKDIVVVFSDDVSVDTMRKFNTGKDWIEPLMKEAILDWNLENDKGEKLSISTKGLDTIKSIKLRNWIIREVQATLIDNLDLSKKK